MKVRNTANNKGGTDIFYLIISTCPYKYNLRLIRSGGEHTGDEPRVHQLLNRHPEFQHHCDLKTSEVFENFGSLLRRYGAIINEVSTAPP